MATNLANGIKGLACCLVAAAAALGAAPALAAGGAEQNGPAAAAKPDQPPSQEHRAEVAAIDPQAGSDVVRKYCVNIAAAATDARFAWQTKKLLEIESRIKARITELDAKEAALKSVLDHRDAVAKEAKETLVNIYAKMKPENAAAQIAALDDEMATAVLAALSPRQAGAIFGEITPPERAAKLAGLLASAPTAANDKKPTQ